MKIIILTCLVNALMLISQTSIAQGNSAPFTATTSTSSSSAKINQFHCSIKNDRVLLDWAVANNQAVDQIEVETSTDGKNFVLAALVFGTDKKDTDDYYFYEKAKKGKIFYRLKIISKDRSIDYSEIFSPL